MKLDSMNVECGRLVKCYPISKLFLYFRHNATFPTERKTPLQRICLKLIAICESFYSFVYDPSIYLFNCTYVDKKK